MDKQTKLNELFGQMRGANLPLLDQSPLVPGDGNPDATVLFIGEAAGFHEAKQQKPFVGQAGKLLNSLLSENGMNRLEVWITNVIKARPPENRDPLPEEIEKYRPFLDQELKIIKPKVIASLGRFAMNWFLENEVISRAHGQVRRLVDGTLLFPLYHPAAGLRNGKMKEALRVDFAKMAELIRQLETGQTEILPVEGVVSTSAESEISEATQKSLF